MTYEKLYVEIFLVILLLILLNRNIPLLTNLSNDTSGKIILIIMISFISLRYGTTSGLLAAFVYLLVTNKYKEGLIAGADQEAQANKKVKTKCKDDRDCGACQYKCTAAGCQANTMEGSEYIKESFIGSRSSGFDRESVENKINKKSILNKMSSSHP